MTFEMLKLLANSMGLKIDWDAVQEWAVAILPLAELVARKTKTEKDDQIVALIRAFIQGRDQPRPMMGAVNESASPQGAVGRGPIRDRLSQRIRDRLRARALENGAPPAAVDEALDAMESDRPLIDWLVNGGFEKILELLMKLLPLFI